MKQNTWIAWILIFSLTGIPLAQQIDSVQITVPELREHLTYLASDNLMGRKAGTAEGRMAARYIADFFNALGIVLLDEEGYQHFDIITSVQPGENNRLAFDSFEGQLDKDFTPLAFSQNGSLSATVVFAGYGFDFSTDSLSWHDYDGMDVTGKWVMILRGNPDAENTNSVFMPFSPLRKKLLVAKDRGAGGVLFVSGEAFDEADELTDLSRDRIPSDAGIPVFHITRTAANRMLITRQQTIAGLESRLNQTRQPASFEFDLTVTGSAEIIKNKATTQNVVAILRGNDPILQSEVIVLGAHYDHLGMGGPGSGSRRPDTTAVHNGADDNASGVAALLEIMEMLAAKKNTLKRSVLGIAFGAEEMGTLGSRYFTDHPLVDLDKITAMINLDMIGRLDSLTNSISIGGSGTAREFSDIIARHADMVELSTQLAPEGYGPSDHAPFYAQDIPVLSLMTGIHQDYHTPEDDIDNINFRGLKTVADFVYATIADLANRQDALVFQEAGPKSRPSMRRRFRVSLGIMPDIAATDIKGVRASGVIPRKPAALAGMKKGDIIVAIEGKPVNGIYEYMHRLSDFEAGQRISVEVSRYGEKIVLSVQL